MRKEKCAHRYIQDNIHSNIKSARGVNIHSNKAVFGEVFDISINFNSNNKRNILSQIILNDDVLKIIYQQIWKCYRNINSRKLSALLIRIM